MTDVQRGHVLDLVGGASPRLTPLDFIREAPEPPDWLDDEARAEWDRVVPGLEALDLLKAGDRAALTVYCESWSRFVAAVAMYRRDGITIVNPDSQNLRRHPAVGIAEAAAAQVRAFAAEFGLSPAAERRLSVVAAGDDGGEDPFSG